MDEIKIVKLKVQITEPNKNNLKETLCKTYDVVLRDLTLEDKEKFEELTREYFISISKAFSPPEQKEVRLPGALYTITKEPLD